MSTTIFVNALRSSVRSAGGRTTQLNRVGTVYNRRCNELGRPCQSRQHGYHNSGQRNQRDRSTYTGIPVLATFFSSLFGAGSDNTPDLTPFKYTTHRVLSVKRISPQHVLIDIQISERSKEEFGNRDGANGKESSTGRGMLDIWHVYVKSPDLQIERPYTPINDVQKDGYIRLLVKRVKGGEVGRYIQSLGEGDDIEIRGPVKTVSVPMQSLDHLTMISTGTGVAPFLQLISKITNVPTEATLTSNPGSASAKLPKLSLIQYLPRTSHNPIPDVSPAVVQSRSMTDSLPAEEFSDFESTLDAGPDIIRHPDVLPPVVRKHLVTQGTLRVLRVRAGQDIDQSLIVDSLTASQSAASLLTAGPASEGTVEKGSWFGWFPSSDKTPSSDAEAGTSTAEVKLQDGKMGDSRVGVMACLPVQSLIPLAGPQYPMGRTKPPIAGVLGSMGFTRDNVWIL